MVNMKDIEHGYNLIKDLDLALGLHTNICAGKPLSDCNLISTLIQENGDFCTSKEIRNRAKDTISVEEAKIEIKAQYLRFKEIVGKEPDYFECHAVFSDNFIQALKEVAKELNLFYENPGIDRDWEDKNNIYGFPFARLNERGLYDPKLYMEESYQKLKDRPVCVAIFHPGFLDQDILNQSSFTLIRPMECDFLCSKWLKDWLKENKIEVTDFRYF